jgi:SAM-dependent methyltransferase
MENKIDRLYPERRAGGFTHVDGTVTFYFRLNCLLRSDMIVLDLGAGRGAQFENLSSPFRMDLIKIKGKVAELIGADVDEAVHLNKFVDRAVRINIGEPLPFPDGHFDLIYSDWVLEHVTHPKEFADEITRLLKPGGWFCARTPNRWGMIGLGGRLIPNSLHPAVIKVLQSNREECDIFPTVYRLNTMKALRSYFKTTEWEHYSHITNSEPPFVQQSLIAMRIVLLLWRFLPRRFYTFVNVFLRKRPR